MFELYADKVKLTVRQREAVTSGSVNAYEARFDFSQEWDGLEKTAVFRAGERSVSIRLDEDRACVIPWEVLRRPGVRLHAGVYGTRNGGETVLPTVWAELGAILSGAEPGENARPPEPELWQQELSRKGDALAYDGLELSLMSGSKSLSKVVITGGGGGTVSYRFGHGLKQDGLDVSVDAVSDFTGDNTLPMTAAGVQASVGNIEALLATI